jgi:kynurenine formamidase
LGSDISIVEFLDNLQELRAIEFYFLAIPLKVKGLDSSMVRAVAIERI